MVYKAAASLIVCAPLGLCVDSVCLFPRGLRGVVATFCASIDPGIGRRFERAIQFPAARVGEAGACRGGPRTLGLSRKCRSRRSSVSSLTS